jgi:hypothetical protein
MGMGVSTLICKLLPRVYTARMVMQSAILDSHELIEMASNWEQLMNPRGFDSLGRIMQADPAVLGKMNGIKAELIGPAADGFSTSAIEVSVRDTSVLSSLQKAIVNGFRNSDYVRQKIAVRREGLLAQIAKTQQQISLLDSSAEFVQSFRGRTGGSSYILDVSTIPQAQSNLQDKLAAYNEKLAFVDDMVVVQGFIRNQHSSPRLSVFLPAGLALGFFIAYIFVMIKMIGAKGKRR